MKNKEFTLIKLLIAVLILVIIILIVTGLIKEFAKSSALEYVDTVEKSSLIYEENYGGVFADGTYKVEGKNLIQNNNIVYTIDYKENTVTGTITISNGKVTEAILTFKSIIKEKVTVKDNKATIVKYGVTKELPTNNETYKAIVYLDPTDLTRKCNEKNAVSTTGTKTGCMKFYAFAESDATYDLILDHNTTPLVSWNSSGKNADGMNEVKTSLESDTSNWKITARLIKADEIAILTGAKETLKWVSDKTYADNPVIGTSISWFYFDGLNGIDPIWHTQIVKSQAASKYYWIFGNTYSCINNGCNISDDNKYEFGTSGSTNNVYGYWTSNPVVGDYDGAWGVSRYGGLYDVDVDYGNSCGVRPVITISKLIISK